MTGGSSTAGTALRRARSGRYVYGDFCSGHAVDAARPRRRAAPTDVRRERAQVPQLTHIGTDARRRARVRLGAGAIYRACRAGR